jgi:hypothetical protein
MYLFLFLKVFSEDCKKTPFLQCNKNDIKKKNDEIFIMCTNNNIL